MFYELYFHKPVLVSETKIGVITPVTLSSITLANKVGVTEYFLFDKIFSYIYSSGNYPSYYSYKDFV